MGRLVYAQTLYARTSRRLDETTYPPLFPFFSPNAQEMYVLDAKGTSASAMSGSTIALVIDLSDVLGRAIAIGRATVWLLAAAGDPWPYTKLLGPPTIIPMMGRRRQGIRQALVDLVSGGQYIAWTSIITADGRTSSYVAPFPAIGGAGNYLTDDDYPPHILTDDDGVPLTAG